MKGQAWLRKVWDKLGALFRLIGWHTPSFRRPCEDVLGWHSAWHSCKAFHFPLVAEINDDNSNCWGLMSQNKEGNHHNWPCSACFSSLRDKGLCRWSPVCPILSGPIPLYPCELNFDTPPNSFLSSTTALIAWWPFCCFYCPQVVYPMH